MLEDLYQELILDHNQHPHHWGKLEHSTHFAHGHNPLCGDELDLYLLVQDGRIIDIRFEGQGCAISKSSASIMTDELVGKTLEKAVSLFEEFHGMLTSPSPLGGEGFRVRSEGLGKAKVFEGVREFPARVKCATLCWHTFKSALESK